MPDPLDPPALFAYDGDPLDRGFLLSQRGYILYQQTLPQTCTVMRDVGEEEDAHGGIISIWEAVNVAVRVAIDDPKQSAVVVDGGAVRFVTNFNLYFGLGEDVKAGDRVFIDENTVLNEIGLPYGYTPAQVFEVLDTDVGRVLTPGLVAFCKRITPDSPVLNA